MTEIERFSITMPPDLVREIDARGEKRATTIQKHLRRYLFMLDMARRELVELITGDEMALIVDVLNGTLFADPYSVQILPVDIEDSLLIDGYAEKWGVDGPALVEKLNRLDLRHLMALADAAERYWEGAYKKNADPRDALRLKP